MNTIPNTTPGNAHATGESGPQSPLNTIHGRRQAASLDSTHGRRLQALGTLSAALAHEMNNLLTPMLGYARLAIQKPGDHELQRKAIHRTHDAAERAVRACTAVMSLARGHVDTDVTHTRQTPHSATIREAIDAASNLLGWTEAKSETHLYVTLEPEDLSAAIAPAALEQVLVNLMQNAQRAMGPGGSVTIHAHRNPATQQLELTLRDTGPGVPDEHAPMLFEPFTTHRTGATRNGGTPGTGLGLWISRALIEAAGGTLELAANNPQHPGACFCLGLPVHRHDLGHERRAA